MEAKEQQVEIEELQKQIAALQSENLQYKTKYKEIKQTLKDNVVVLREVQHSYKDKEPGWKSLQNEVEELRAKLAVKEKELNTLSSQMHVLKYVIDACAHTTYTHSRRRNTNQHAL